MLLTALMLLVLGITARPNSVHNGRTSGGPHAPSKERVASSSSSAITPQTLEAEPMVSTRVRLPRFSLGPAPFPVNLEHLDFELFGDAKVHKGLLKLTTVEQSQKGAVWSKNPISLNGNWQIDLRFQVGGSPNLDHYGDGFAMWIARERGVMGEALGGPTAWNGLGVFFDTFKNENFRGKKHPYVYGKVSLPDMPFQYNALKDDNTVGCHAPFRDSNPKVLATTVARITLKDSILSVIMRPKGAVDWIQCFEIRNVRLPEPVYIGVSAMTGGLLDNHYFFQLTTFGNVDVQPFSYAHSYKPAQMPDMWKEMKESGKIARNFEDWEENDSFLDDLHWTVSGKVKSHLNDDYDDEYIEDDGYGGENDGADPYKTYGEVKEDEDDDEDEEATTPVEKKNRITRPKQAAGKTKEQEQMARDLDVVLQRSPLGSKLQEQHKKNSAMMESVRTQLQNSMQDATDSLHRAAREIRIKEHELSERVLKLGQRLKVDMIDPFEASEASHSSGWFWPFFFILGLMAGAAGFGYTRYKKFMKQHVL